MVLETKFKVGQEVFFLGQDGFYICSVYSISTKDVRFMPMEYRLVGNNFEVRNASESQIVADYDEACLRYPTPPPPNEKP